LTIKVSKKEKKVEKIKKVIIYIRNPDGQKEEIYDTLCELIKLVSEDPRLNLLGAFMDVESIDFQRSLIKRMHEANRIDGVVCKELSELCYSVKTYLDTVMMMKKGLLVFVIDANGKLTIIEEGEEK